MNRMAGVATDNNISDCMRQINDYRRLCEANSRRRREDEMVGAGWLRRISCCTHFITLCQYQQTKLAQAHNRLRILETELLGKSLPNIALLEQHGLHLASTRTSGPVQFAPSSADLLVQEVKRRANFHQKWCVRVSSMPSLHAKPTHDVGTI